VVKPFGGGRDRLHRVVYRSWEQRWEAVVREYFLTEDQMGLIQLFQNDQSMSMRRFLVELSVLMIVIAFTGGYFAAKILIGLQQWLR
jgi:hypothetical protein